MSVQDVLARIAEIQSGLAPPSAPATPPPGGGATQFSQMLQEATGAAPGAMSASSTAPLAASGPAPATAGGAGVLAAREAGMPLGDNGQGFGSVDALNSWAQRAGRAVPNGPGVVPRPGDLIVWDEHIGVVENVQPDGSIATIEGNSSDRVSRRVHPASSALGYVRMG
jgi:hypothetical protein